jgi:hypothetical protein
MGVAVEGFRRRPGFDTAVSSCRAPVRRLHHTADRQPYDSWPACAALCCSLVGRVGSVIISVPVLHIRCRPKTAVRDDNGARGRRQAGTMRRLPLAATAIAEVVVEAVVAVGVVVAHVAVHSCRRAWLSSSMSSSTSPP